MTRSFESLRSRGSASAPVDLGSRAMDDLRFIRETMERSGSFTAVSGQGVVAMGVIALLAAAVSSHAATLGGWIAVWLGAAALSFGTALFAISRKARAAGTSLLAGAGRKFAWNLTPPLLVGGLMTVALVRAGAPALLPGTWLLLYGTGVVAGGAFSVSAVPAMGFTFMVLGGVALFLPAGWGDAVMALGFGGLHLLFGVLIWRRHGG